MVNSIGDSTVDVITATAAAITVIILVR